MSIKSEPFIAFYHGQSLMPPDQKGLTVGFGIWVRINGEWYRVDGLQSTFKIVAHLKEFLQLRKWPSDE